MRYEQIHLKEHYPFLGDEGRDPILSVYLVDELPEMQRQGQKRPGILICPGGGYHMVSGREGEPIALHMLPMGYHAFVIHYSVHPHSHPVHLREVAAAMDMIGKMQEQWLCDPDRVAIMGFSAGGHLAAHYSNRYNCPEVREVFPGSRKVKASVLCYPVIFSEEGDIQLSTFQGLTGQTTLTQEQMLKYSVDLQVTAQTPPAFIWHTATDQIVPVDHSLRYARALAKYAVPFTLHIYPEGQHGLATVDDVTNGPLSGTVQQAAAWFDSLRLWLKDTL